VLMGLSVPIPGGDDTARRYDRRVEWPSPSMSNATNRKVFRRSP
jgi:hypothetical protein